MRTETINVYKFQELPTEAARERARDWYRTDMDFAWSDEALDSIKTFCDHFEVTLRTWSVGAYAPIDYSTNAENCHFRGMRLSDFIRDHMPTGYYIDSDLWVTFYDVFKRTGCAPKAFEAALDAGFRAWRADMESQLEDEYIDDHLTINEYEFTEDGCIH